MTSNLKVILVSTGIFQEYIIDNIQQLLKLDFNVHVITDKKFFNKLTQFDAIKKIDTDILCCDFDNKSKLDKVFRNGFWNNSSKRLFLLYQYMKEYNITNVIHLENDVLLYDKMNYPFENKIYLTMDSPDRCIPGIVYIPEAKFLDNLINNYDYTKNDMVNMANFYKNNRNIVTTFPIDSKTNGYNTNFNMFESIFDGAAMGQYLGGVDPKNNPGNTIGFVNETCVIKYDKYKFKWMKKDRYVFPYLEVDNKLIHINNLHIHSKNLKKFILSDENTLDHIMNNFFNKQAKKTSHETLGNYDNVLVAGGENAKFYTHICYHTIYKALSELLKQKKEKYVFVETGCSAHGTKSTLLWDIFVQTFNGKVMSVDLNKNAVNETNKLTSQHTNVVCSNSLNFLPTIQDKIDFLYLDSYDVDFLNPVLSAKHHLEEFNKIKHLLHKGSIVLIDDTPVSPEWLDNGKYSPFYSKLKTQFNPKMTGKGSLVNKELEKMGATKILHQYQVLWQINDIIGTHINIFTDIYEKSTWGSNKNGHYNGSSGSGSAIEFNKEYIVFLRKFIDDNNIKKVVDLGCGDWQSSHLIYENKNIDYYGYDAYEKVVNYNSEKFPQYNFSQLDILNHIDLVEDNCDMYIIKDVIQHWTCEEIYLFLDKLLLKKCRYIMVTNSCAQKYDDQDTPYRSRPLSCNFKPLKKYNFKKLFNYKDKEVSILKINLLL